MANSGKCFAAPVVKSQTYIWPREATDAVAALLGGNGPKSRSSHVPFYTRDLASLTRNQPGLFLSKKTPRRKRGVLFCPSKPVSRILYPAKRGDDYLSGIAIAGGLKLPTMFGIAPGRVYHGSVIADSRVT